MSKKLKLVPDVSGLDPPRPLGRYGLAFWHRVQSEYVVADAGGVELLCLSAEALDRAETCRAQIERDGLTVPTRDGGMKDHPLLKHEIAARALCARLIQRLGLDVEPVRAIGRPGGRAAGLVA
jgi:hypothetical protein